MGGRSRALAEEFFAGEGARERKPHRLRRGRRQAIDLQLPARRSRRIPGHARGISRRASRRPQAKWDVVELEISFRSTPAVLDAVDAVFARAWPRDGVSLDGADIRHGPSARARPGWSNSGRRSSREPRRMRPGPGTRPCRSRKAACRRRGSRWRWRPRSEAHAPTRRLEAKDRPISPGDVMVLVRRRDAFHRRAGAGPEGARRRRWPASTACMLAEQLAVEDMVALGQVPAAARGRSDSGLRAERPALGFNEEALFELAWRRQGSLWDELRRRDSDEPEFRRAASICRELLGKADFVAAL